ncbi:hypothetical protein BH23GEM6_BH23GEM6_01880 [soil metagenome]
MSSQREESPMIDRVSNRALWLLYGFTAITLLGYATFGVHPGLLAYVPQVAGIYALAFRFFAVTHVWMAFLVLALFLTLRVGGRWIPAFVALYLISLLSELAGTTTGLPFGEYRYSPLMDPMWFGHVPIVIPLSWFFMAIPSYALARVAVPSRKRRWARVLLASTILVSWDLSLDPAMSYATRYWIWGSTGAYYGMPWLNLFGWYVTGLLLMTALALLGSEKWIDSLPLRWLAGFYLVNLALPVGMNMAAGLWGAVLAAAAALAGAYLLGRRMAGDIRTDGAGEVADTASDPFPAR